MRFGQVRLLVKDFNGCVRFYRDVMGLTVVFGEEDSKYAEFKTEDGASLALFVRQSQAEAVGTTDLPSEAVCQDRVLLSFAVDDLGASIEELCGRGARFVTDIQEHADWGVTTAYLRDPDGNLIELFVHLLPAGQ